MRTLAAAAASTLVAVAGCGGGGPPEPPRQAAQAPGGKPLVREGQPGRATLDRGWVFRLKGDERWRRVSLPHDWNGADAKDNKSDVGVYRRRLKLARGTRWVARFEGAGHTTTVEVNGRRVGRHVGNYLPFEVDLPAGRSTLTVRVSSVRTADDLTHWRPSRFNRFGNGGWWNFGGIHREVTVRPARGLDISRAQALPRMACPTCPARVTVLATLRNLTRRSQRPAVSAQAAGRTVRFPRVKLAPGQRRELTAEFTIARPRLWDVGRGNLYKLAVRARGGGSAAYTTWFGVRDLRKDTEGQVFLNGRRLVARGMSLHEDDARVGSAWQRPQLDRMLARVQDLNATAIRAHYPLHPYAMEQADRRGILVWNTAPVNIVQNVRWAKPAVKRAAVRVNEEMVLRDRGHPSVLVFSIADELPIPVQRPQQLFIRAAVARVRALDPTRMVALDRVARNDQPDDAHPVFRTFDALGINEYFGWYRGALPPRPPAYARDLGPYYDRMRRLQPGAALFVTEFGAEAGQRAKGRGSHGYQAAYLRRHLAEAGAKPYLNGAFVWALQDFRVHGSWTGGNPRPRPPWNQKGIVDMRGRTKPGYRAVRDVYRRWARERP